MNKFELKRIELHNTLKTILGSNNVYFQPPEHIKLNYPCIIYNLNTISLSHADNSIYKKDSSYTITLIETDPLSETLQKILDIVPQTKFDRRFCSDGLYHDVFTTFI